jgi:hypothetical protein
MGMSHQVAKVSCEGDKCPVEGMQYILLALVYLGGESIILWGFREFSFAKEFVFCGYHIVWYVSVLGKRCVFSKRWVFRPMSILSR